MRELKTYHALAKSEWQGEFLFIIIFPKLRRSKIFERKKNLCLPFPKFGKFETGEGCTHLCKVPASGAVPKLIQYLKKRLSLVGGQTQQQWVSPHTHSFCFHLTNTSQWICILTIFSGESVLLFTLLMAKHRKISSGGGSMQLQSPT